MSLIIISNAGARVGILHLRFISRRKIKTSRRGQICRSSGSFSFLFLAIIIEKMLSIHVIISTRCINSLYRRSRLYKSPSNLEKRKKYQNVAITYAFRIIRGCRKLVNIPFNFEEHKSRYYGIVKLEFKISYLTSRD